MVSRRGVPPVTGLSIAALACAVWVYLALGRGGFWRARQDDRAMYDALPDTQHEARAATSWPRVVAVIPARNEAELVSTTVGSLLAQRYAGEFSIIVVDDQSEDGTAAAASRAANDAGFAKRLTVLASPPLPEGWTGKLWAIAQGVAYAETLPDSPEFLLLTDADIRYAPDAVAALVFSAVENDSDLSSLMVKLRCESFAERAFIPAFVFFFQMLYPFAWVNQPNRRTAAAAGGCMLVRRLALREAGGIASIRGELIDDCALARRLKSRGPIRLALGERVQSLRAYPSVREIRRMVVRSAYAQLRFSPWRLVVIALAMLMVFVAPVLLTFAGHGWTRALALAAWGLMAVLFAPMQKRYRLPVWWGVALPAIALAYLAFTVESAYQHFRGRGGMWKGRAHGATVETP